MSTLRTGEIADRRGIGRMEMWATFSRDLPSTCRTDKVTMKHFLPDSVEQLWMWAGMERIVAANERDRPVAVNALPLEPSNRPTPSKAPAPKSSPLHSNERRKRVRLR